MANRKIFYLNAWVVDANGTWSQFANSENGISTPTTFDSKNYSDDIEKAQKRAKGAFSDIVGLMSKVDNRKLQCVTLQDESGTYIVDPFVDGSLLEPDEPNA